MAHSDEQAEPISPAQRRRLARTLGRLALMAFGLGAVTATAWAFHARATLWTPGTGNVSAQGDLGLLANTTQTGSLESTGNPETAVATETPTGPSALCVEPPVTERADPTPSVLEGLLTVSLADNLSATLSPDLVGQLGSVPWPNIHELAKLARVPILMYHDIMAEKEVFFDVTPEELEAQFERIKEEGLTPITLPQLVHHLRTGSALPPKPVLLSFDDGYEGHYTHAFPLLQAYGYPAVFSVFPGKMDGEVVGRSTITWDHLKEMAADPLVTIASHTVTHPPDLRVLDDAALEREVVESKTRLETELGMPIRYFTYPTGYYDERVAAAVAAAGYEAALTMSNDREWFAGESDDLLSLGRFGQSSLETVLPKAWEGLGVPLRPVGTVDFASAIRMAEGVEVEDIPLVLISGGRPVTIHADSRYQVPEIVMKSNATAAVDGGFFSLKYLDSNVMIGPVLSQATRTFVPGNASENPKLNGRPLVLISPTAAEFIPFRADAHNTLEGIQAEMPQVTDAFVASAWLVRDGQPQPASSFTNVFDYDAYRHRAFWGINRAGQPVIGITRSRVDSVHLGKALHQAGLRDAVMLDSGASTSMAYRDRSLVEYEPRPVPHLVALLAPEQAEGVCPLVVGDGVALSDP
ncbi:polysaccharide deacetylase family protein [Leptolyngbya sp. PCC 6406]|uniref:polysaccharide deacetylase family protein n=1 Tax=Leptolyngbya sp. PCC 6406 TaxID=1173264 RepID=UPI0002AD0F02|nr:polysaccharide deacetylase family protein [Leptolyngbya sp. PCC 6406]